MSAPATFVDVLRVRARETPHARAYTYLRDGEDESASLTFAELDRLASVVATRLREMGSPGDRAILLYPQGLDFLVALFGCFYAGIIPAPVSLPNRQRGIETMRRVAEDCGARWILTESSLLRQLAQDIEKDADLAALPFHATDAWGSNSAVAGTLPPPGGDDIALLQYTSGSTGTPRGVIVRHASLVDNHRQIEQSFGHDRTTVIVSWLPMFHDMGLGTVLQAVWLGVPCVLMAPAAFLQKPVRWLRTISRYRATTSGGPDFGYDLCVRKVDAGHLEALDLSSWRIAYNGSEPVRAATLDRFSAHFGAAGFRGEAFHPVYGLAESTLFVSSPDPRQAPQIRGFSADALERGRGEPDAGADTKRLVGCGHAWLSTTVRMVDPEQRTVVDDGTVGEIWVRGPSVASGYWRRDEETASTFGAMLASDEGPWLRTGDLGFARDGQLFVTGRLKDLIIIRGRNHYPQDIEATSGASHAALEPHGAGAFSIDADGAERLVVAQEVRRTAVRSLDVRDVIGAIRKAIADAHGLQAWAVVLLKPGTLPRTSSGKVRRKPCRAAYLAGELPALSSWTFWLAADEPAPEPPPVAGDDAMAEDLAAWIRHYGATRINSRVIDERRTIPPYVVLDFGNRGLLGMQAPAAYGGLGLGHGATVRVIEQLAAIDLTLSLFVGLNNYLGIRPIARHASSEMRDALLPRLATGRELAAFALTEPEAGSNPRQLRAAAVPDGAGRWRLRGTKIWSGAAAWAGALNVFARHENDGAGEAGISGFVVRQGAAGLRQGPEALTMGMRGLIQNTVILDGVAVEASQLLGERGRGMDVAHDAMMHARLAVAAASVGGMKRCAQLALRYASRRRVSTGRLLANPVTLSRLGRTMAAIVAVETLVRAIAKATDNGVAVPVEAFAACKSAGPELLWQAADDLVQILGGRGYIEPNLVPQLLRDARVLRIFEGPTETMNAFLGARLLAGAGPLHSVAASILGAPAVAPLFAEAADRAQQRLRRGASVHWIHALAGELTTRLLLLAAVTGSASARRDARIDRTVAWAQSRVEEMFAALDRDDANAPPLSADAAAEEVGSYVDAIGEIEQSMSGEDYALDPLLAIGGTRAASVSSTEPNAAARPAMTVAAATVDADTLRDWLTSWLAGRLKMAVADVLPARSFADHGLDSLAAVELVHELSERVGRPLDETLLWNCPSIDVLVAHLTQRPVAPIASAATPAAAPAVTTIEQELAELERLLERRS